MITQAHPEPQYATHNAALSLTLVEDEAKFRDIREEWNRLLVDSASDTIFLTWEWMEAWWQCFRRDDRLWLLLVRENDGRLVGIAPFRITTENGPAGIPLRTLCFLASSYAGSEYLDFIFQRGYQECALEAVCQFLIERKCAWDLVRLSRIPESSPTLSWLARWAPKSGRLLLKDSFVCSAVTLPDSWDSYLQSLQPRFRTSLRSKERNLARIGTVRCLRPSDPGQLETHLEAFFDLHQARWERVRRPGSFRSVAKRRFYRIIAKRFSERGWLRFYSLAVDQNLLAAQFGFGYNKILFHLQEGTSFANPAWSVGNILRGRAIRELIEEGYTSYDFLHGLTSHKKRWGARPKRAFNIVVSKRSAIPLFHTLIPHWEKKARATIKSWVFHRDGTET